jgi:hypothetical protein
LTVFQFVCICDSSSDRSDRNHIAATAAAAIATPVLAAAVAVLVQVNEIKGGKNALDTDVFFSFGTKLPDWLIDICIY